MDTSLYKPYVYDRSAVDRYYDSLQSPSRMVYAVTLGAKPIGELQLKRIDRAQQTCTLSIHLQNDAVKNKGFGTQAIRLGVEQAFLQGLKFIFADAVVKNTRSQHVLQKAGFVEIGEDDMFKYYRYTEQTIHA